jgi:hypothetical protein
MNLTVEDYFDDVTNEKKIQKKIIFSDNANIITREVKETRSDRRDNRKRIQR